MALHYTQMLCNSVRTFQRKNNKKLNIISFKKNAYTTSYKLTKKIQPKGHILLGLNATVLI